MPKEPKLYCEAGIHYYVPPFAADEIIPFGICHVRYYWRHKPTGRSGMHYVYLLQPGKMNVLIEHWNRTENWEYSLTDYRPVVY